MSHTLETLPLYSAFVSDDGQWIKLYRDDGQGPIPHSHGRPHTYRLGPKFRGLPEAAQSALDLAAGAYFAKCGTLVVEQR